MVLRNLSKKFGGVYALENVDLTIESGEVHGLLGQNGSGKSTLIKILAGYHEPEPGGVIDVFGRPMPLDGGPGEFRKYGLAFVHQHLGLVPSLSVLENLRIGDFAGRNRWAINWRAERQRAKETFEKFDLDIDPAAIVGELPQVTRALIAIIRAVEEIETNQAKHGGEGLLILDEPTPFLPRVGVEQLFGLVRRVVAHGASVMLVTHDVDEVMEITDRATVLRDGRVAGTLTTKGAKPEDFVEHIIGRRVVAFRGETHAVSDQPAEVKIENLSGGTLADISISLHRGEIIGLTGLIGTGYDEVPAILCGSHRASHGSLAIGERRFDLAEMTPSLALKSGIAYLPADRLGESGVGSLAVSDNATLPVLPDFLRHGLLDRPCMSARSKELGAVYDVRPNRPGMNLETLSGGNQQKVLLMKWLQMQPALLLLDEPTQGVDVGARQKILQALDEAAQSGTCVIVSSTDYEQLEQICDRVLIFARGEIIRELRGDDVTKDGIAEQCYRSMTLTGETARAESRTA